MQGYSPSLEARVLVGVSFKDLVGDTLFAESLGEGKATQACADNENMHNADDYDRKFLKFVVLSNGVPRQIDHSAMSISQQQLNTTSTKETVSASYLSPTPSRDAEKEVRLYQHCTT